jgi:hypothetical protein
MGRLKKIRFYINPGANPTNSEFTTRTPALYQARAFFKAEENIFVFKTH